MNFGVLLFVLGLSAVACSADEPPTPAVPEKVAASVADEPPASADTAVDAAAARVAVGTVADADDSGKFFLFAQRSVTTSFLITTSRTEVLSTCFTALGANTCAGRRKKRFVKINDSVSSVDEEKNLDSSISVSTDDKEDADPKESPAKNSKYFFTLWETQTSTLVVVSTSTNAVNIVSVSAFCTIAGNTYPLCPGG